MKKVKVPILLALLMIVVILAAGCSKGTPTNASNTQASTQGQSLTDLISKVKDKANQVPGISLDYMATTPDGKTSNGEIWGIPGKIMKVETTVNGAQAVIIVDLSGNTITMYQPDRKSGTKMEQSGLTQLTSQSWEDFLNAIDPSKTQDLGTENVNGETCRVIQYSSGSDKTIKMWLSEKLDFPVQIYSTTADGKTTKIEYTNVSFAELPSNTFTVPADIKIKDQTTAK